MNKNKCQPMQGKLLNILKVSMTLILLLTVSCVKYSFKGALPSYIKTIAIPLFEDRSNWVGLQENMTEEVINAFVEDNSLRVIEDEENSDLLLTGTIMPLQHRRNSIAGDETVEEEQLVVSVKVECVNQQTDKPLWSSTVSDFGVVSGESTLAEQDAAIVVATDKIVIDIVNRTIAAW